MSGELLRAVPFEITCELSDLSLKLLVRFLLLGKIVIAALVRAASCGISRKDISLLTLAIALLSTFTCLR